MPLYFAYGSNMDLEAMRARCPASKPVSIARLARHRFFVTADGYASVARNPRESVWGLLWDLALADVPALDRYESLHTGLYGKTIQPVLTDRGPRRAMLYIARSTRPGAPKPGYLDNVVSAAEAAGLPEPYLRGLRAGLPRAATAVEAVPEPSAPKVRPRWSAPEGVRRSR
jgi:hypothetical protein